MKRNFNQALLGLTLLFAACSTEELVFPDKVQSETESGTIDVIVKPKDVKIEGTYDKKFVITWPTFSDKIEKVILSYEDAGVPYTKEITDFSKNLEITTSNIAEYGFKFVSVSKDGRQTDPVTIKSTNKGLYIAEVLERSSLVLDGRSGSVRVPNPSKSPIKVVINYPSSTGVATEVIQSSDETIEFKFNAALGKTVTIQLEDVNANKLSRVEEYVVTPKKYTTSTDKIFWTPYTDSPDNSNPTYTQGSILNGNNAEYGALIRIITGRTAIINYLHFTKTRNTSTSAFNGADQRTPVGPFNSIFITNVVFYLNNGPGYGTTPPGIKLYGIKANREEVLIKTITGNTTKVLQVNFDALSDVYIGIRYDFSGLTGAASVSEIDVWGFPE